jgi:RNA polymerase sigma-70 factor (ECF subfamily)
MNENDEEENDESLMLRIQKGEHQAFVILVQKHTSRFYSLAYRVLSQKEDAEDVVQEAFLKIWNKPQMFKADRGVKFTTWFYKVVINLSMDRLRKSSKYKYSKVEIDFVGEEGRSVRDYEREEQERIIEQSILKLPKKQRLALNLCFYEGVSNKEAADILGVTNKAIESLLIRGKQNIKDQLIRKGVLEKR